MSYHIMMTSKVSDIKGNLLTKVQVMDFKAGRIIYVTLDELEKDQLSEDLKEYTRGILPDIMDGRWHYTGKSHKTPMIEGKP